jgi:predicted alpha/beta superfamily hydrolase
VRFFTRSLVGVVEAYARETNRARDLTLLIGHALGGLPGQRLIRTPDVGEIRVSRF